MQLQLLLTVHTCPDDIVLTLGNHACRFFWAATKRASCQAGVGGVALGAPLKGPPLQ